MNTCNLCDREAVAERGTPRQRREGRGIPLCRTHADSCDHCGRHTSRAGDLIANRGEELCGTCLDAALDGERRDNYGGQVPGERITSGPFAGLTVGHDVTPISRHRVT